MHKSGFVNIIGNPNVGKSTLLNALIGERMSIITNKPQTTRHRILGILSDHDYQVVFSDTPGIIQDPSYEMQKAMNRFVHSTFEDADLMLLVTDTLEKYPEDHPLLAKLKNLTIPIFLIINKIDLAKDIEVLKLIQDWQKKLPNISETIPTVAIDKKNVDTLTTQIIKYLPEGPVYFPKDQLTDKPYRFFVSEIIREQVLEQFKQEIPYSVQIITESFKETKTKRGESLVKIGAILFVMRESQKMIILANIKALATASRKNLEKFLNKKVYLDITIKVKDNWRDDEKLLEKFGY